MRYCREKFRLRQTRVSRWVLHLSFIAGLCLVIAPAFGQSRDHLTDQESELVRDNQQLDKRIEVFIKAIDRRFAIITGATEAAPVAKKKDKNKEDWGEPPKGTHAELLADIAGILDEAITNIDDVNQRDAKNPLISRSLRTLTAASNRYLNELATLKNQTKDPAELSAIERVADNANQVVEAGSRLPAATPDSDTKKKKP